MKKPEVLNLLTNLEGFLDNIKSINNHPYSTGVDVDKLVKDLQDYVKDMKAIVEQMEELIPDSNEPEEISE
jgi:predicted ATP-grasp superfamily ATP-dependent carboligase